MYVPVISKDGQPLMPTTPSRARRWIRDWKATPFWNRGVFCVRLNQEPSDRKTQPVAVGVDPGSKKEGLTVKSEAHTYLNINADAVTHVKKAMKDRRMMRDKRRQRKTPYRACRRNRSTYRKSRIAPSTLARWQWKLRLLNWLRKMYPVSIVVVEDIKAHTKGGRRWNAAFSPLQQGKNWFYEKIREFAELHLFSGFDTKRFRDELGLKKSRQKLKSVFSAHCVDSWVLANEVVKGHSIPDNTDILLVTPLYFHRRQLHRHRPMRGGVRVQYGGTRSLGFKRGSIASHPKYGVVYIGGTSKGRITLQSIENSSRLTRTAKPEGVKFLAYSSWRTRSN